MSQLRFSTLMDVYQESNLSNGAELYSSDPPEVQLHKVQTDFYHYLNSVFFQQSDSYYAIWESEGVYVSALRTEPYSDGLLLCALETAPCARGRGFAFTLMRNVLAHLKEQGITRVGIMATDGTVRSGIFRRELESCGMEAVEPSAQRQADVMHLIYENIKAGRPADMERFRAVQNELTDKGAEVIILGCTELSIIKRDYAIGPGFLDNMEVLAQQAILRCEKPLKQQYRCLISK